MSNDSIDVLRIAIGQFNPTVGDISGNLSLVQQARIDAAAQKADLIVFSELFISGYPPEDLVLNSFFVKKCQEAIERLAKETLDGGPGIMIGTPWQTENKTLHNAVAVLDNGKIIAFRFKVDLPNYSVFDEKRVFKAGPVPRPVKFRGVKLGVPICEDMWGDFRVCEALAKEGAEILIVPNSSPYCRNKIDLRLQIVLKRVSESGLPLIYVNQLGGQDELVFDGGSFVVNCDQTVALQMSQFEEGLVVSTWKRSQLGWICQNDIQSTLPDSKEADWRACVLGLRDYVNKNGFENIILGLSGGIDSALCAAMSVDALGQENVQCIMMPYRYTSQTSLSDAAACAQALGVKYDILSINKSVEGLSTILAPLLEKTESGITEENLQSRSRGMILMAMSNKLGSMVVTTGNKSEMSIGYTTLYGDMNGGFNPIKDLYKMHIYALSRWRNQHMPPSCLGPSGIVIPPNIISKAPSAELKENQLDQNTLPPYLVMDTILESLIEEDMSSDAIVRKYGFNRETVIRIEQLLHMSEYKRRQAAPGVKITRRSFGRDRRYPMTHRWSNQ
ncbi:NAD+ synthase [Candidatus Endowatersipora endosymbiont of Watersipora subatra]|uniref:NAD+ synthase n=1 Tax=Candidatus Endowatersipora endosymbiont of Watersipora subatra TaxID=3077946 RepID=UPI00312C7BD8